MLPTVHYNMGGIPTNYHGEAVTKKDGDPDTVVPGLMAVGEAACVSVHGANRLGSNSLIDLVVFGRAAGLRCAEIARSPAQTPRRAAEGRRPTIALARFDRFRNAKGATPTAELRLAMQKAMQEDAPCSAPARRWPRASSASTTSMPRSPTSRSPTAR